MFSLLAGILGLILLTLGSEVLIRAAKSLGLRFGLSTTTIGVIVIGYGTSLPELSSSYMAVLQGKTSLAVGNVLGSNSFNILFILGLSALLTPLAVTRELLRKTLPLMILLSLFTFLAAFYTLPLRFTGLALFVSFIVFSVYSLRSGDRPDETPLGAIHSVMPLYQSLFLLLLGMVFLIGGTTLFIQGAVWLARVIGVSEAAIGLSVVAIGTSLPEVFTSVIAALKKERSLVLGNIVGSNIFNLSAVLGGSLIFSGPVDFSGFRLDLAVMLISALICGPFFFSGRRVGRGEGALLVGLYVGYFSWLLFK